MRLLSPGPLLSDITPRAPTHCRKKWARVFPLSVPVSTVLGATKPLKYDTVLQLLLVAPMNAAFVQLY